VDVLYFFVSYRLRLQQSVGQHDDGLTGQKIAGICLSVLSPSNPYPGGGISGVLTPQ
jgi:hypothetical protein